MRTRPRHDCLSLYQGGWSVFCLFVLLCSLIPSAAASSSLSSTPDPGLDDIRRGLADDVGASDYQSDSQGDERNIIGRDTGPNPTGMVNNTPQQLNAVPGDDNINYWTFSAGNRDTKREARESEAGVDGEEEGQDLATRQTQVSNIFISINICLQPNFLDSDQRSSPPQLSFYVSTSSSNQHPGPRSTDGATKIDLEEGFANYSVRANQVFIGVVAPQASISSNTAWSYEIAASTDGFYHSYNDTGVTMFLTDSDPGAALLVTDNLTSLAPNRSSREAIDKWATENLPLTVFVANTNDTAVQGVMHSYCGLQSLSSVIDGTKPSAIRNGVTHNQPDSIAEQQFYVPNLNRSSVYYGFLARSGNGMDPGRNVVGGGGTVFPSMTFPTKRDANCAVIYNLTFCNTVEYAVPANPSLFPKIDDLMALYDNEAQQLYQNFNYSLQQIPCNTTSTAQYSLARNCDDCAESYKTWLCAVTIPRCEDFSSPSFVQIPSGPGDAADYDMLLQSGPQGYLMPRNLAQAPIAGAMLPPEALQDEAQMTWLATNSSRNNATIAGKIQPGPYHEVLPCEDLCYNIVRDCPAALGFGCPQPGSKMLRASYGRRGNTDDGASLCSAPGSVYRVSAAVPGLIVHLGRLFGLAVAVSVYLAVT